MRAVSLRKAVRLRKDAELLCWMSLYYSDTVDVSHLLDQASKRIQAAAADADIDGAERSHFSPFQNCFLLILISYVHRITKGKNFVHMAALVRCGCRPDDPNGKYTADAVRKVFNRFRRDHSSAWASIDKAVRAWCKNFADFPERILIEPNS